MSNKSEIKDLRVELFNFRKSLSIEQEDVLNITNSCMDRCHGLSEKRTIAALTESLKNHMFADNVKSFVESLNNDISNHDLLYTLKDLYKVIESKNQGQVYRQPLVVLLDIINLDDDASRMKYVLNELAQYSWVPDIKVFLYNLTEDPQKKENLLNGGRCDTVYTIAETVDNGHLVFLKDAWFLLTENSIEKTLLETHLKDEAKLRTMRVLETALNYATITEDKVNFNLGENLTIGLSVKKPGVVFINEEKLSEESTLDNLFASPIIPIVNKNFHALITEVAANVGKFVEFDVVKQVTNLANPHVEVFAFNYKNNIYAYNCDARTGRSFFKYESANDIINEVKRELNFDLSFFYKDKLDKENKLRVELEDKTRKVKVSLAELEGSIDKVQAELAITESEVLRDALNLLNEKKADLTNTLLAINELLYTEVIKK